MSTAMIANLPFQTGGAVAAAAGRAALWGLSRFMRQPLRNSGVVLMIGLSGMAGSNALYFQSHRHPAPLFGTTEQMAEADIAAPPVPAARPKKLHLAPTDTTTTGSVDSKIATPAPAIGNSEVFEVQRKLQALGLFDAAVDGLYGSRTARAIKAFEERQGLKPKGELTREIVDLILSTSIIAEAPKIDPLPTPDPLPAAKAKSTTKATTKTTANTSPTTLTIDALPAPPPLVQLPTQAIAEASVGDAIDTIIDGVQTLAMTKPNISVPKRAVQTIAVKAVTRAAEVAAQPLPEPLALTAPVEALPDQTVVAKIQRGLASLGFLHGEIDGVAGEATAKAIRNFEVYYRYDVTGRITPELVDLLVQNGAVI
ncbi:MAG: peptidoglycan-binding domain-containing protein [Devosia sp.]